MDQAISDQLAALTVTQAQNAHALNGMIDRNLSQGLGVVLSLGIQQINAAGLKQQTSLDPLEAAAAANVRTSQDPAHVASLRTAHQVPGT